jgi:hypothetical protein
VRVFAGTVLVAVSGQVAGTAVDRHRLEAGQEMRLGRNGAAQIARSDAKSDFVRSIPGQTELTARRRIDLSHATASQSSQYEQRTAKLAIDGDMQTYSHTAENDDRARWQLDLGEVHPIAAIVLHNRSDSLPGRFRDLTVTILAADGKQSVWKTDGVNKDNMFGGGRDDFLTGPAQMTLDVVHRNGRPVNGRFIRVERTPVDRPESYNRNVLFIAECEVYEAVEK